MSFHYGLEIINVSINRAKNFFWFVLFFSFGQLQEIIKITIPQLGWNLVHQENILIVNMNTTKLEDSTTISVSSTSWMTSHSLKLNICQFLPLLHLLPFSSSCLLSLLFSTKSNQLSWINRRNENIKKAYFVVQGNNNNR